jgi:protein SSD1
MSPAVGAAFSTVQNPMGQFSSLGLNLGLDGQTQGIPRGHGRRHSVNVINKTAGQSNAGAPGFDEYNDGFVPPANIGGHSRQGSRVENSWRISEYTIVH